MKRFLLVLAMATSLAAQAPVDMLTISGVEDLGQVGVMHRFRVVAFNNDQQYGLTSITVRLQWRGSTTVLPIKGVVAPRAQCGQVVEVAERPGSGDAIVTPAAATFVLQSRSL